MGVCRNLTIGWFCELRKDLKAYNICEEMADLLDEKYAEFIVGTDPICGERNNICVFNKNNTIMDIDDEDAFTLYFESIQKYHEIGPSEAIVKFCDIVNEVYGNNAITLKFGIRQWYS